MMNSSSSGSGLGGGSSNKKTEERLGMSCTADQYPLLAGQLTNSTATATTTSGKENKRPLSAVLSEDRISPQQTTNTPAASATSPTPTTMANQPPPPVRQSFLSKLTRTEARGSSSGGGSKDQVVALVGGGKEQQQQRKISTIASQLSTSSPFFYGTECDTTLVRSTTTTTTTTTKEEEILGQKSPYDNNNTNQTIYCEKPTNDDENTKGNNNFVDNQGPSNQAEQDNVDKVENVNAGGSKGIGTGKGKGKDEEDDDDDNQVIPSWPSRSDVPVGGRNPEFIQHKIYSLKDYSQVSSPTQQQQQTTTSYSSSSTTGKLLKSMSQDRKIKTSAKRMSECPYPTTTSSASTSQQHTKMGTNNKQQNPSVSTGPQSTGSASFSMGPASSVNSLLPNSNQTHTRHAALMSQSRIDRMRKLFVSPLSLRSSSKVPNSAAAASGHQAATGATNNPRLSFQSGASMLNKPHHLMHAMYRTSTGGGGAHHSRRSPMRQKQGTTSFRVYGCPLQMANNIYPITCFGRPDIYKQQAVPYVLTRLCNYIEENSSKLTHEGIFRVSGNARLMEKLRTLFDHLGDAPLESESVDVATSASMLKMYLRELPEPLIPTRMNYYFITLAKKYSPFITKDNISGAGHYNRGSSSTASAHSLSFSTTTSGGGGTITSGGEVSAESQALSERQRVAFSRDLTKLVRKLPIDNYNLLKYLACFLYRISLKQQHNKMCAEALGIVFGPNVFRIRSESYKGLKEQELSNQIMASIISNYKSIFDSELTDPLGNLVEVNDEGDLVGVSVGNVDDEGESSSKSVLSSKSSGKKGPTQDGSTSGSSPAANQSTTAVGAATAIADSLLLHNSTTSTSGPTSAAAAASTSSISKIQPVSSTSAPKSPVASSSTAASAEDLISASISTAAAATRRGAHKTKGAHHLCCAKHCQGHLHIVDDVDGLVDDEEDDDNTVEAKESDEAEDESDDGDDCDEGESYTPSSESGSYCSSMDSETLESSYDDDEDDDGEEDDDDEDDGNQVDDEDDEDGEGEDDGGGHNHRVRIRAHRHGHHHHHHHPDDNVDMASPSNNTSSECASDTSYTPTSSHTDSEPNDAEESLYENSRSSGSFGSSPNFHSTERKSTINQSLDNQQVNAGAGATACLVCKRRESTIAQASQMAAAAAATMDGGRNIPGDTPTTTNSGTELPLLEIPLESEACDPMATNRSRDKAANADKSGDSEISSAKIVNNLPEEHNDNVVEQKSLPSPHESCEGDRRHQHPLPLATTTTTTTTNTMRASRRRRLNSGPRKSHLTQPVELILGETTKSASQQQAIIANITSADPGGSSKKGSSNLSKSRHSSGRQAQKFDFLRRRSSSASSLSRMKRKREQQMTQRKMCKEEPHSGGGGGRQAKGSSTGQDTKRSHGSTRRSKGKSHLLRKAPPPLSLIGCGPTIHSSQQSSSSSSSRPIRGNTNNSNAGPSKFSGRNKTTSGGSGHGIYEPTSDNVTALNLSQSHLVNDPDLNWDYLSPHYLEQLENYDKFYVLRSFNSDETLLRSLNYRSEIAAEDESSSSKVRRRFSGHDFDDKTVNLIQVCRPVCDRIFECYEEQDAVLVQLAEEQVAHLANMPMTPPATVDKPGKSVEMEPRAARIVQALDHDNKSRSFISSFVSLLDNRLNSEFRKSELSINEQSSGSSQKSEDPVLVQMKANKELVKFLRKLLRYGGKHGYTIDMERMIMKFAEECDAPDYSDNSSAAYADHLSARSFINEIVKIIDDAVQGDCDISTVSGLNGLLIMKLALFKQRYNDLKNLRDHFMKNHQTSRAEYLSSPYEGGAKKQAVGATDHSPATKRLSRRDSTIHFSLDSLRPPVADGSRALGVQQCQPDRQRKLSAPSKGAHNRSPTTTNQSWVQLTMEPTHRRIIGILHGDQVNNEKCSMMATTTGISSSTSGDSSSVGRDGGSSSNNTDDNDRSMSEADTTPGSASKADRRTKKSGDSSSKCRFGSLCPVEFVFNIEKQLAVKRILGSREIKLNDMSVEQLRSEKLELQKNLLRYEHWFDRPNTRLEFSIVGHLYERYRAVKTIKLRKQRAI